jgi:hypothetical protein
MLPLSSREDWHGFSCALVSTRVLPPRVFRCFGIASSYLAAGSAHAASSREVANQLRNETGARTKALAAGRTHRLWTARAVLISPLPPVSEGSAAKARCGYSVISWGAWYMCQQKHSDGVSFRGKKACLDCPMMKKQLKMRSEWLIELSTMSYGSTSLCIANSACNG